MTDKELKKQISDALDWDPSLDAADIGVSVDEGVATLRGNVASFTEKMTAERDALHVFGIKGVANDLVVRLPTRFEKNDTEIAQAAVAALKWTTGVLSERVTVTVTNGWLTLTGAVPWNYQKNAAARVVRDLLGVRGVTNNILVQPPQPSVKTADVRDKIEAAFKRSAELDARRISIAAEDGKVVLTGSVHSWTERIEAERAAWAAPGVRHVEDRLAVVP